MTAGRSTNRRDSYTILRDTLRWQVALVLAGIVLLLTLALSLLNTRLGFGDTALLAWIICGLSAACLLALLKLPRGLGASIFFGMIALSLLGAMVFGQLRGKPMHAWRTPQPKQRSRWPRSPRADRRSCRSSVTS